MHNFYIKYKVNGCNKYLNTSNDSKSFLSVEKHILHHDIEKNTSENGEMREFLNQ